MKQSTSTAFNAVTQPLPPEWDLSAYYSGPNDPKIDADLGIAMQMAKDMAAAYKGKLGALDAAEMAKAIDTYDRYQDVLGGVTNYVSLLKAKDTDANSKLATRIDEKTTEIANLLQFFDIELCDIPEARIETLCQDPALVRYAEWLRQMPASKPYMLSEAEEKLDTIKSLTGSNAWVKLFDEVMANLSFDFDGQILNESEILTILLHDADRSKRRAAYDVFCKTLEPNSRVLTFITNTLALDKAENDKLRSYEDMMRERNLENNIESEVVDALSDTVVAGYPATSHRYYEIKRRELGLDTLMPYDRLSPIAEDTEQKPISFDAGRAIVLDAFAAFSPEMARIGQIFFDNNWIDARVTKGKDSGAFAAPGVVSKHPVMLINWMGTSGDVATLAHELGHNVHQYLAAQAQQSNLLAETPLTLAETASVFGERLVFERSLSKETDPSIRKSMLAKKIEEMLATVVRQVAFLEFEKAVHSKRRFDGEISSEEIGELWMKTQKAAMGPAFTLDAQYASNWSYIPHFIHTPFYVYAYAFGDCLVNALYEIYEKTPDAHKPEFVEKYMDLLKAGGAKHHSEALKPFGIDLRDPSFWQNGIRTISGMIDRLEVEITREKALKAQQKPVAPAPV